MMNKRAIINETLKYRYKTVAEKYSVFGLFLYGSQNYGLDTEGSDIDTYAIVFPTAEMIAYNKELDNKESEFDGGKLVYMDIRKFFSLLLKGNPNALEIMESEYFLINADYEDFYYTICEKINWWHLNPDSTLEAFKGIMKSYYDKFVKTRNMKYFANAVRCTEMATSYSEYILGKSGIMSFYLPASSRAALLPYKINNSDNLMSYNECCSLLEEYNDTMIGMLRFNDSDLAELKDNKVKYTKQLRTIQKNMMIEYLKKDLR